MNPNHPEAPAAGVSAVEAVPPGPVAVAAAEATPDSSLICALTGISIVEEQNAFNVSMLEITGGRSTAARSVNPREVPSPLICSVAV